MQTHQTIDAARETAKANKDAREIIEIEHAAEGRAYIVGRCSADTLRKVLVKQPMAEIKRIIAGHNLLTEAEIAAERDEILATKCKCERCHKHVDGRTCYHQEERMRFSGKLVPVIAYYCASCESLLKGIGAGEYSDMEARAAARPSYEPETKEDF